FDKFVAAGRELAVGQCSGGVVSRTFCQQLSRQSGRSLRQKTVLFFLRSQQRLDLDAQVFLAGARLPNECRAFIGRPLEGQRHQLVDSAKSLRRHSPGPCPSSRHSHALAFSYSRFTVPAETAMTWATSSIPRLAKYLNFTTWLFLGSNSQRWPT